MEIIGKVVLVGAVLISGWISLMAYFYIYENPKDEEWYKVFGIWIVADFILWVIYAAIR